MNKNSSQAVDDIGVVGDGDITPIGNKKAKTGRVVAMMSKSHQQSPKVQPQGGGSSSLSFKDKDTMIKSIYENNKVVASLNDQINIVSPVKKAKKVKKLKSPSK